MLRTHRLLIISIFLFTTIVIFATRVRLVVATNEFNSPPTAANDFYNVHGITSVGPFMANDSDPDGDPITMGDANHPQIVTSPSHGSIIGGSLDRRTYNPTYGYVGPDSFTYQICDNHGNCSIGTVNLSVNNNAPVANTDFYNVHGTTSIGRFMTNDSDPDGDWIGMGDASHVQIVTPPSHGSMSGNGYPDVRLFTPTFGYVGPDTFTYQICDSLGSCSLGTVNLSINNNAPLGFADFFIVHEATNLGNFLSNDYDPDGDVIGNGDATHPFIMTQPTHGTASGNLIYYPSPGYSGPDSLVYSVCDGLGGCSTATVYILVIQLGPTIKAPYACGCPMDPGLDATFNPGQGALPQKNQGERASGPISGDPVNLATGRESFLSPPDLSVYDPSGPTVVWQRAFLSDRALTEISGYGSPGFTRGWVHNYDLRLQGTAGAWNALTLTYPNGATEALTPQLSGGIPTGAFTVPAGAPYRVTGVSGSPTGTWQSVTVTWKDQTQWKFTLLSGTTYALNKITNRMGKSLTFSWNSSRALTQVVDDATSSTLLTLAYLSNGKISTATDAYGRQVVYTFNPGSSTTPNVLQTVSQVVPSGTTNPPARFTYGYATDKGPQLSTITVPSPTGSGNSTATINYSLAGKVTSVVDANGNQRVYTYNSGTTQVQVKDALNNTALSWTQKFNTNNLDTGITDAASHSTTIAYADSANPLKPTSETDRNGHVTSYTYDSFGNVLTVTTPRTLTTYTWSYANFALGRLTSIQEGTKPATTITYYEPSGLVNTITRPEPNNSAGTTTTTYTYDSLGNLLTIVTPGNNATSSITTTLNYTSDGAYSQSAKIGQPLTVTDNLSHATHLRYDSQGRTTSVTDALGNETDFSYNLVGQLVTTTYPATGQTGTGNGHTTNAYMYPGGPLTSTTFFDESNTQVRQVSRSYGLEGESLAINGSTEPATNTYDALYRVKTLKDGNNNTTTYAYNTIGRLSLITLPGGETTQFTSYDNDGHLLQRIDGNNVTTNYIYTDPESLLTDVQYPATSSLNVHFTYDGYGRRSGMTDGTGSQSYTYGNLDELLSTTTTYPSISAKTISYSYYPDGSRSGMTTPAGSFAYSYDAAGRSTSSTNPFAETTNWGYYNNNWLQTQTLHNGATATYTYNGLGQVTRLLNQIGSTTISDFSSVAYDGVGNRPSVTASIPGATSLSGVTSYTYDSQNQLTQESSTRSGGFVSNFGFDAAGNPTTFKGTSKSYNNDNQETGTGFTYDGNGNPTVYNGTALTFDPENRMTSYGSALTAGYTGEGLRSWKQTTSGRIYFLYDGTLPVIELDVSGNVVAVNSFGVDGLISRHDTSTVFYSFDAEGNAAQKSDSNGTIGGNFLFSAHGDLLSGTLTDPYGYKAKFGYYTDLETGLKLLTQRYYDSSSGRFITRDPIGYLGGINLYSHASNNPITKADPSGLSTILVLVGGRSDGGSGNAIVVLFDRNGNQVLVISGLAIGQGTNRMATNNDTPFGVYGYGGSQGGNAKAQLGEGYGTGKIIMNGVWGEITQSGRDLIRIHGGGSGLRKRGFDPYGPHHPLLSTQGCVRVENADVENLISEINRLTKEGDPMDYVFVGSDPYLTGFTSQGGLTGDAANAQRRLRSIWGMP